MPTKRADERERHPTIGKKKFHNITLLTLLLCILQLEAFMVAGDKGRKA